MNFHFKCSAQYRITLHVVTQDVFYVYEDKNEAEVTYTLNDDFLMLHFYGMRSRRTQWAQLALTAKRRQNIKNNNKQTQRKPKGTPHCGDKLNWKAHASQIPFLREIGNKSTSTNITIYDLQSVNGENSVTASIIGQFALLCLDHYSKLISTQWAQMLNVKYILVSCTVFYKNKNVR